MSLPISKKLVDDIANLTKLGVPPLVAALSKGLTEEDFVEWMRKGEVGGTGSGNYMRFFESVTQAQAEAEAILVGKVRAASTDHWQAATWLLERLSPERWTRKSVSVNPRGSDQDESGADPFAGTDKVVPLRKTG